jgi:hypothetical protein
MTITAAAKALILSSAVTLTVDGVTQLVVYNAGGEVIRKAPQQTNVITAESKERVFYLTEAEAVTVITRLALVDGSNREIASADVNIDKQSAPKSLSVRWTLEATNP